MTVTRQHVPMSAAHPGQLLTRAEAAEVLPRYLGPVLTVEGIRARDWDAVTDPALPPGLILVRPAALTIAAAELADVELALTYAEHRRQAARFLRTTVVRVALESGLTDLRPFARPALNLNAAGAA